MSAIIGKVVNAFAVLSECFSKTVRCWQQWLTKVQSGGREILVKNHPSGPGEERGGLDFRLQD